MDLLYDFGDSWQFTIRLERVEPPGSRIKAPESWKATARRQGSIQIGTSELGKAEPRKRAGKAHWRVKSPPINCVDWSASPFRRVPFTDEGNEPRGSRGGENQLRATLGVVQDHSLEYPNKDWGSFHEVLPARL